MILRTMSIVELWERYDMALAVKWNKHEKGEDLTMEENDNFVDLRHEIQRRKRKLESGKNQISKWNRRYNK